ncbi:hypothetical protein KKA53_01335 [Candidatus Dependentiae bacterium]|nr:hypothetical protein [Candidatus Dependentiae bacterium]
MSKKIILKIVFVLLLFFVGAGENALVCMSGGNGSSSGSGAGKPSEQEKADETDKENDKKNDKEVPPTPNKQELMKLIEKLQRQSNGYNSYAPWWKKGEECGKDYAKKICIKHISEEMFGKDGANLTDAFEKGFASGLGKTVASLSVVAATNGFIDSAESAVSQAGKTLFKSIGIYLSIVWDKFKRVLFHNGANPVSPFDIRRWGSSVRNMIEGLIEIADKAKTSARIEPDLGLLHLGEFQDEADKSADDGSRDGAAEREVQKAIDKNWREIASGYLSGIVQMVAEIEFRQRYYGRPDTSEIVFCLERIKIALIGDGNNMIVDSEGNVRPGGGVYARIAQAKSFADLASTQTIATLELFKKQIIGLLGELAIWVKEVVGEERKKNGYHSGGYGSLDD